MATSVPSYAGTHARARPPRRSRGPSRPVERYVVAVVLVAVAVVLKILPTQIGQDRPFLLLNGAVILAAWHGGRGPAVVALVLSALAADYLFLPPAGFGLTWESAVQLGIFVVEAFVTGGITVGLKEARARADTLAVRSRRAEDQLRRLNRAHLALSTTNEALVRAEDEEVLLEEVCRAAVEVAGYRLCWVGRAEHDEARTVRPIAVAGHDESYVTTAEVSWADNERGRGPVGTAIRTGKPFVQQDVETHPAFGPWRAAALERGYASVIALPLRANGSMLGALAIYAADRDAFDDDALRLLMDLANDLAYGITALRNRARVAVERARFESVIMQAPVAVAVLSGPEHTIRLANPRWLRLGLTGDAPIGRPLREAAEGVSAPGLFARLDAMFAAGKTGEVMEERVEVRTPEGGVDVRYYNLACQPLSGVDGAVSDLVVAVSDVTEQVAARRTLEDARACAEEASRAKDEFLRVLSHELRTPLMPILCWAQALRGDKSREPRQVERGLDIILASARAQARIVGDLLDVSEIVAGKMKLEMGPIDLGDALSACVAEARGEAAGKGVAFAAEIAPDVPMAGDAVRLQQVARNLLSNAIKFTPRGGHVAVAVTREDGVPTLRVSDTGKGIAEGEIGRVFDPFHTGDPSVKRAEGGLGLGLFIVRHVVEAHGGRVTVESRGPGQGATFVATFPPASK